MSKNNDNPFALLDKSKFPSKKANAKTTEKKSINMPLDLGQTKDEESLFLNNMRQVAPLGKKAKYHEKNLELMEYTEENTEQSFKNMFEFPKKEKSQIKPEPIVKEALPQESQKEKTSAIIENNEAYDFFSELKDVKPLAGKERVAPPPPETFVLQNDPTPLLHDFEDGKVQFSQTITDDYVQCHIIGLDLLILGQLQNRHYNPESSLDLHGLKAREAYDALLGFMKNAHYKDMRCVLIVTGKGLNSLHNIALLRNKVCDWLIDEPFKHLVLAYCSAKVEDGGSGALYVLLRKRRKNTPLLNWEKLPNDYDVWADKV